MPTTDFGGRGPQAPGASAFQALWLAQTVSMLGSEVSLIALPTTALLVLHAGPAEVGGLAALQSVPFLVLGPLTGMLVDRVPRRPLLVAADIGNAVVIGSVPVMSLAGALDLRLLYAVALASGALSVVFAIAQQSYLPELVGRGQLTRANARLQLSVSLASVAGPGLGGILIAAVGAPRSMAADGLSFAVSAALLLLCDQGSRRRPGTIAGNDRWLSQLGEGIGWVAHTPALRSIVAMGATMNIGARMASAVLLVLAYQVLRLTPRDVGLALGLGGASFLVGALMATTVPRLVGAAWTLALAPVVIGAGIATVLLGSLWTAAALPFLGLSQIILNCPYPVYNTTQIAIRQAVTPIGLMGRANALMRTVITGAQPLGGWMGGMTAARLGVGTAILAGAAITCLASGWVLLAPGDAFHVRPTNGGDSLDPV